MASGPFFAAIVLHLFITKTVFDSLVIAAETNQCSQTDE
jgi:hypothetical protein